MRKCCCCLLLLLSLCCRGQIHLWENARGGAGRVTLTPYLPEETVGDGIIVCPGGSYFWLDTRDEGRMVCQWLQREGIAAFLLEYRTAGAFDFIHFSRFLFNGNQHPDMLADIQRAIDYVRCTWGPDRLGVMGFSAGGHLAVLSAEMAETDFTGSAAAPLGPDFVAAIYPVVTLSKKAYVHKRSRRGLLGERRIHDPALQDALSVEEHVPDDMPPVFLLNCRDDKVVHPHNAELLDSALTAHGIPHLYIAFEQGGHGFGANTEKQTAETATWQAAFMAWLKALKP